MEDILKFVIQCLVTIHFVLSVYLVVMLRIIRWLPCLGCDVCRVYMSGSWAREFTNLSDWYAHLLRQSPTQTIHVHVLGCTITANPANVEHMLKTGFDMVLGSGIFNVDGHAWSHQRKMSSFELGSVAVRSYAYRLVAEEVDTRLMPILAGAADSGLVIDLQDVFRRFAFDTVWKISFGLDPGCLEQGTPASEAAVAFDTASRLSAIRSLSVSPLLLKMKRMLNIGTERELKKAIMVVDELAEAMIRERRRNMGVASNSSRNDLLSWFMASATDDVGDDDKFLRDIVVSFLLAGRDTISSGLTMLFMFLSRNPAVAAAIRAEAGSRRPVTFEHLKGLHYTHAVIHESLRLFPPVQFDSKFCAAADVLPDGSYVERGSRVMYHPYAMGRMPSIWGADYETFRPERWLTGPGRSFVPVSPFKYPVFQAGLLACLGKELVVTEMKAVSVAVVRAFEVEVVGENGSGACAPKFAPGLAASLSGGLPVRVSRRV